MFQAIWKDLRWDSLGALRQDEAAYVKLAYVHPQKRARTYVGSCARVPGVTDCV